MPLDFATVAQVRTLIANDDQATQVLDMQEVADLLASANAESLRKIAAETLQHLPVTDQAVLFPLLAEELPVHRLLEVFRGIDESNLRDRYEIRRAVELHSRPRTRFHFLDQLTLEERESTRHNADPKQFADPVARSRFRRDALLSHYGDAQASLNDNIHRLAHLPPSSFASLGADGLYGAGRLTAKLDPAQTMAEPYTQAFERDFGAKAQHDVKGSGGLVDWVHEVLSYRSGENSSHGWANRQAHHSFKELKERANDITDRIMDAERDGQEHLHVVAVPMVYSDPIRGQLETARFEVYKETWAGEGEVEWRLDRVLDHKGVQTFKSLDDMLASTHAVRRDTLAVAPQVSANGELQADAAQRFPLATMHANTKVPEAWENWAEIGGSVLSGVGTVIGLGAGTAAATVFGAAISPAVAVGGGILATAGAAALVASKARSLWDHVEHDASFAINKHPEAFGDALVVGASLLGAGSSALLAKAVPAKAAAGWGVHAAEKAKTLVDIAREQTKVGHYLLSPVSMLGQAAVFGGTAVHDVADLHDNWGDMTWGERIGGIANLSANVLMAGFAHKVSAYGNRSANLPEPLLATAATKAASVVDPTPVAPTPLLTQTKESNLFQVSGVLTVAYTAAVGMANAGISAVLHAKGFPIHDPHVQVILSQLCYVFRGLSATGRAELVGHIGRKVAELQSSIDDLKKLRDASLETEDVGALAQIQAQAQNVHRVLIKRADAVADLVAGKRAVAANIREEDGTLATGTLNVVRGFASAAVDAMSDKAGLTGIAHRDREINAWSTARIRDNAGNLLDTMSGRIGEVNGARFAESPTAALRAAKDNGKPLPVITPDLSVAEFKARHAALASDPVQSLVPDVAMPQLKTMPGLTKLYTMDTTMGRIHEAAQVTSLGWNISNTAMYLHDHGFHLDDPVAVIGATFWLGNVPNMFRQVAARTAQTYADTKYGADTAKSRTLMAQFQGTPRLAKLNRDMYRSWALGGGVLALEDLSKVLTGTGMDHWALIVPKLLGDYAFAKGNLRVRDAKSAEEGRTGTSQLGLGIAGRTGLAAVTAAVSLATKGVAASQSADDGAAQNEKENENGEQGDIKNATNEGDKDTKS